MTIRIGMRSGFDWGVACDGPIAGKPAPTEWTAPQSGLLHRVDCSTEWTAQQSGLPQKLTSSKLPPESTAEPVGAGLPAIGPQGLAVSFQPPPSARNTPICPIATWLLAAANCARMSV